MSLVGSLGRRPVPGEDAVVETMDGIDNGKLELQPGRLLDPDGLAEASHDRGFVLMDGEEKRAPFQRREQKDEPDNGEHGPLHETNEAGGKMRAIEAAAFVR